MITARGCGGWFPRSLRTQRLSGCYAPFNPLSDTRSCQIPMELRPWLRPSSIASRNGSHKLVDGTGLRGLRSEALNSTPNPVVTAFSLAGFAVLAFAFPLVERFSGL